jgi:hypothetical protein
VLLLPSTLLRFPSPILGGIGAAVGSIPLWFATRHWLQVSFRNWIILNILGLAAGFAIGSWIFQSTYPPAPIDQVAIWTGWQPYLLFLWATVGCAVGVAYWVITRQHVKHSAWIILVFVLAGALLGGWLGVSADNTMISYGQTTNGQGERLQAVAIDVLLSLSILGTVVGVCLSVLRVQQNLMQPRAMKAPPTYRPA